MQCSKILFEQISSFLGHENKVIEEVFGKVTGLSSRCRQALVTWKLNNQNCFQNLGYIKTYLKCIWTILHRKKKPSWFKYFESFWSLTLLTVLFLMVSPPRSFFFPGCPPPTLSPFSSAQCMEKQGVISVSQWLQQTFPWALRDASGAGTVCTSQKGCGKLKCSSQLHSWGSEEQESLSSSSSSSICSGQEVSSSVHQKYWPLWLCFYFSVISASRAIQIYH